VVTTLFVANTHTPLLFFTTDGMVYKLKTWRLPLGGRASRGKAIVNILPIEQGVSHRRRSCPWTGPRKTGTSCRSSSPPPRATVRRNALSDFTNVMRNGKIAMKFEGESEGWRLINARICLEDDDVMLVTQMGRAIRFPTTDVRVFNSRASTGVRGIRLAEGDEVVSMSVIRHFEAEAEERAAYLKMRRLMAG
jgi:DNA gyrase subunit A